MASMIVRDFGIVKRSVIRMASPMSLLLGIIKSESKKTAEGSHTGYDQSVRLFDICLTNFDMIIAVHIIQLRYLYERNACCDSI